MLLAVSCRTIPERVEPESVSMYIPAGADVIIRADIDTNTELIEPVLALFEDMPENITEEFLGRTEEVWAGLDLNGQPPFIESNMVAGGEYPVGAISTALWWNPEWKKGLFKPQPEENYSIEYWYEKEGINKIAFPEKRYMFASSGDITDLLTNWSSGSMVSVPIEWLEYEKTTDVTIMTRNLSPEDYGSFVPQLKRMPIESIILGMKRIDDDYIISGRFYMDSDKSAFLFATFFRTMILTAKEADGSRLFDNPREIEIRNDGSNILINNMKLTVAQTAVIEGQWMGTAGMESEK